MEVFSISGGSKHRLKSPLTLYELQYADDAALPSHSPSGLQDDLNTLADSYHRAGLTINTKKTEILQSPSSSQQSFLMSEDRRSPTRTAGHGSPQGSVSRTLDTLCNWYTCGPTFDVVRPASPWSSSTSVPSCDAMWDVCTLCVDCRLVLHDQSIAISLVSK